MVSVDPFGQAKQKGVDVGWSIDKVNGDITWLLPESENNLANLCVVL